MRVCPRCAAIYREDVAFCGVDGTQLVDQNEDPLIGQTIDRYHVVRRVGSGGMGNVYEAHDVETKQPIALKVLAGELAANRTIVKRFELEAASIRAISHPNVISIVDAGATSEGLHYIVMELVHGINLHDALTRHGAFPPARAAAITRQLASGLDAAHRAGLVHRDLKPSNVMLTSDAGFEYVKLLDFGVVHAPELATGTRLTKTGLMMGTPGYMAPEQAVDAEPSPLSDLYSLGALLYEMLAGRPMFPDCQPMQMLLKHMNELPEPLPMCGGLEFLAYSLIEKAPEKRPQSAAAVVVEIDRLSSKSHRPERQFVRSIRERKLGTGDVQAPSIDLVMQRLKDEVASQPAATPPPERRPESRRLGDMLLEAKAITPDDLARALERQKEVGGRLGRVLLDIGALTEPRLLQALSRQLAIDIWRPTSQRIHPRVLEKVPAAIAHEHQVMPVALKRVDEGVRLIVAALDPLDEGARAAVGALLEPGVTVSWLLVQTDDLQRAIAASYPLARI